MKLTGPRPEQPAFYQTLGRRLVYNHPNLTLVFGPGPGGLRRAAIRPFTFKANSALSTWRTEAIGSRAAVRDGAAREAVTSDL